MNKLVDNSALQWSAEDFDNMLNLARYFNSISEDAFNKLSALTQDDKLDIVNNAICEIEEQIMDMISYEIDAVIIDLSKQYNK